MNTFDTIERAREFNEGAHPEPPDLNDETGRFTVRVVHQHDCIERTHSTWSSLRRALSIADSVRGEWHRIYREKGSKTPQARVHVDVIDEDDPERGSLDWDDLG